MNQLGDKPEEVRKRLEEEKDQKRNSRHGGEKTGAAERTDEAGEPGLSDEQASGSDDQNPL
ncbi:hypothetical protein ABZ070_36095 [Streptomyces sp. NPDC006283]|uniref:hypothetical protein n=1 Tax=Streptomyces sp. NPDC006283 TaxID=3156741 RepID=UPI0033ADCB22